MFRGGDYVDDPKFADAYYAPKNTLDITVRLNFEMKHFLGYLRSITKSLIPF
jgi:hypothetical protein